MYLGPFYITTKRTRMAELKKQREYDSVLSKRIGELSHENRIFRSRLEGWNEGVKSTG